MKGEILQHIKALSNSKLGHMTALERFAHCLNSVYGNCSFISFEICPKTGKYLVRLIFSDDQGNKPHFDNFMGRQVSINDQQLHDIVSHEDPVIVNQIKAEFTEEIKKFGLPAASMMVMPLYLDGQINLWVIVLGHTAEQFDEVELEQAVLLANLAGTYMARITETEQLATANAWIQKELDDIGRIQKLLLPQSKIEIRGTDIASHLLTCDQAGGDYYDVVNLSQLFDDGPETDKDEAWGAIIADASGHGAASAVEIAMFDALLRTYQGSAEQGPAGVFNYTNKYFFTRIGRGSFISAAIVTYNPESQTVTYANAGHPPAIVISPQGDLIKLDKSDGIPLGVDPEWLWYNLTYPVKPGSIMLVYTDGIIEALSPQKEQFGIERLESVIKQSHSSGTRKAQDYVDAITHALNAHQQDHPRTDDQCLVVMSIEP